jgi:peptide methionine sulfoxide reductase msrA/msrB
MNPMHPIISITLFTTAAAAVVGLGLAAAPNLTPPGRDASTMTISETDRRISASGHDVTPLSRTEVERLASKLTPEQYRITQKSGTEQAFCGTLLDNKKEGMYVCVVCGLPLFKSEHKFTSGTGWPSFFSPFDADHVTETTDEAFGMVRVEIECARCGSHLGHVFPDGPPPTGQRYCLNSEALAFVEKGEEVPLESRPLTLETGYFAGGCFWGVEYGFQQIPGVISVESGYQQGRVDNPTYRQICTGDTGHAESVKVVFDPRKVSYEKLVRFFLFLHDPTQLNRQGPDFGTQYRSGIYTVGPEQQAVASSVKAELATVARFNGRKIVTEIEPTKTFWPAEDYHQDYIIKTGRSCHVDLPAAFKAADIQPLANVTKSK